MYDTEKNVFSLDGMATSMPQQPDQKPIVNQVDKPLIKPNAQKSSQPIKQPSQTTIKPSQTTIKPSQTTIKPSQTTVKPSHLDDDFRKTGQIS